MLESDFAEFTEQSRGIIEYYNTLESYFLFWSQHLMF